MNKSADQQPPLNPCALTKEESIIMLTLYNLHISTINNVVRILQNQFYDPYSTHIESRKLYKKALEGARQALRKLKLDVPHNQDQDEFQDQYIKLLNLVYDKQEADVLLFNAVNRMLDSAKDSHTYFLNPSATKTHHALLAGCSNDLQVKIMRDTHNHSIYYIKINAFSDELIKLFDAFATNPFLKKTQGIIVDVRDNVGGHTQVLQKILSYFFNKKVVAYFYKNFHNGKRPATIHGNGILGRFPLVVLADASSKSAAEIFTSAIKENNRGLVLGAKTSGKASAGRNYELIFNASIMVTVDQILSRNGQNLEQVGVEPHKFVRRTMHEKLNNKDPVLNEALEDISKQIQQIKKYKH